MAANVATLDSKLVIFVFNPLIAVIGKELEGIVIAPVETVKPLLNVGVAVIVNCDVLVFPNVISSI